MGKWLSLFDGMSCLQIAGKELGISPDIYYASEIDKHAIKQTQLNFPKTIQLGSVTKWETWDIDWATITLIGAGSPCQGFSFAGKQLAFDDPRSKLFFVFIDILNHARKFNPDVKFLLENVDMKKEHMNVINNYCGLFAVNINSNLVSAQNRNRWYWSNIRTKQVGLFAETHTDIPQPEDRGILLKDILEINVAEKYYLSDKMLNYFDKRAANFNGGKVNIRKLTDKASTLCASMASCDISDNFIKVNTKLQISETQDKSSCFTAGGNSGGLHSDMDLIIVQPHLGKNKGGLFIEKSPTLTSNSFEHNNHVRCVAHYEEDVAALTQRRNEYGKQIRKQYEAGEIKEKRMNINQFEPRIDGKTNCLTSVQKDNLIAYGVDYRKDEGFRIRKTEKSSTLLARAREDVYGTGLVMQKAIIRRLTPTECAALQTVPLWYKWKCSDTQQYRMLGNGMTIKVMTHCISYLIT